MADLDIAWMALLAGIAIGLYFRVWMLPTTGLIVFGLALLLARDGFPFDLMEVYRAVQVLVIFEIGYMLAVMVVASDLTSYMASPRGRSNVRRPPKE